MKENFADLTTVPENVKATSPLDISDRRYVGMTVCAAVTSHVLIGSSPFFRRIAVGFGIIE